MAAFKLSNTTDPNKMFLINRSALEGRIDPHQYHIERREAIKALSKHELKKLKDVVRNVKITTNQIKDTDVYIGLENIISNTGEYVKTNEKQTISSAGIFKKGHILFPKLRPYLNKVHLTKFDGICSTEFHVFESNEFLNEFLAIYLRSDLIVNQTKHLMTGNTLPRLQTDDIYNLPVPIISLSVQRQIVNDYNVAYNKKQKKENEAQALLKSIDTYILKELGINLPEKTKVLENKMFTTSYSKITGSRFDPKLYDSGTTDLIRAIENANFRKVKLKSLIIHSMAGDWGKDENEGPLENYTRCLVIRATEFDNNGNLNLDNSRVKFRLIDSDKLKKMDIKENDLLIEKSGGSIDQPVGRIALITSNYLSTNQLCYSNFIHKIRVDSDSINPEYLFYFLKLIHNIKLTDAMQSQTNGIRNLIMNTYFSQLIVLPEAKKQMEIVKYIQEIVSASKSLQQEGRRILEATRLSIQNQLT